MNRTLQHGLGVGLLALLAGCTGNYGGSATGAATVTPDASFTSEKDFFEKSVGPNLGLCRTCHVPGALAATHPKGSRFMLSPRPLEDYEEFRTSWEALGKGVEANRILTKNSGELLPGESHSIERAWPQGSQAYGAVKTLLSCWNAPATCALNGGGTAPEPLPLLGSARGGHLWFDYCEGRVDKNGKPLPAGTSPPGPDAELPADPRSLVQPGVNLGKAVYFNDEWHDCHSDPARVGEMAHPKTCGEWRARYDRGRKLILGNGAVGAGSLFAGTEPDGYAAIPASVYNNVWRVWGLTARPDNFDQLVAERWGFAFGTQPNPYPLPGEDPNATNGGSGRLPTAFTQLRKADGGWSGNIGITCHGCHSSVVGSAAEGAGLGQTMYGAGSSPHDMGLMSRDLGAAGQVLMGAGHLTSLFGKTRGTGNPINVQAIILMTADFRWNANTVPFFSAPSSGSEDAPAWWNMGHRPVKFFDGFLSMDADRADLGLFLPFLDKKPQPSSQSQAQAWVRLHAQDAATWVTSLKSPAYPLPVNGALAEQGAVLFHSKSLWAAELNNPVPKPEGGNGSCASCHGAYSPRYVNDTRYLETPVLEGMAGYLVPHAVIGTDPARADSNTPEASEYGRGNFYAYPETDGLPPAQDCTTTTRAGIRGTRKPGYLAPPLYGVWATAPYFHNGSVPNVWEVLKSRDRQPLWRRVSSPARADQQGRVVMGFDTSLQRAYDAQKMGWQYEAMACGAGTVPYLECDPLAPAAEPPLATLLAQFYRNFGLSWNVVASPPFTNQQAEDRKIYNTHAFSQGNAGHTFSDVLTDAERQAIIEYLKTL